MSRLKFPPLPASAMSHSPTGSRSASCSQSSTSFDYSPDVFDRMQTELSRMELSRRQKVSSCKLRRTRQLRAEYKSKVKDEHARKVQRRRTSLDTQRTLKTRTLAQINQQKRNSRRRAIEARVRNHLKKHELRAVHRRRTNVLRRKKLLMQQRQWERQERLLRKQRRREQAMTDRTRRRKTNGAAPSKSAAISKNKCAENKRVGVSEETNLGSLSLLMNAPRMHRTVRCRSCRRACRRFKRESQALESPRCHHICSAITLRTCWPTVKMHEH